MRDAVDDHKCPRDLHRPAHDANGGNNGEQLRHSVSRAGLRQQRSDKQVEKWARSLRCDDAAAGEAAPAGEKRGDKSAEAGAGGGSGGTRL